MFKWTDRRETHSRDLLAAFIALSGLLVTGTLGYSWLEGWNFLDGLYMTFLTLTTIGFNEVRELSTAGRWLTMAIGLFGIGTVAVIATRGAQFLINSKRLKTRKMAQLIHHLTDHYIICGFGRIGSRIAADLENAGVAFVIIENAPSKIALIEESKKLFIHGDAEEEASLLDAGLNRAKGLILTLPEDSMNVFVSLLAREFCPDLFILARANKPVNHRRLIRAGANKVISPYEIGAHRMSQVILKPNVVRFMENVLLNDDLGLSIEEVIVNQNAELEGKSLSESNVRQHYDVIVVGISRNATKEIKFNPGASETLHAEDAMVVLGNPNMIEKLRAQGCQ